jgi:serine/threonine-protein kinase
VASGFRPEEKARAEQPGTVIGPYKLLEQIGEGGFGVVFMAEQQQPVRRQVALKVLKPGMDTKQVVARFEAERQALALMDHPHIAHVHDAGTTDTGRPFFVMELIRGSPITQFCDENRMTPRERLELFVTVCQAVQHAHQKGIIHRDLKPSNVLVALLDGTPTVKVIDFGIAKALGHERLTEKTLFTGFAHLIGTPLYISPEQADMSGRDVDTRTDIYALGVLLYELLTGTTPFDKERLKEVSYDELRRIIREEEPAKPSARISTLGQATNTVSANRTSEPRRLRQLCSGELDWMVMKALEKDRNRRYETASSFAADVQRYLHGEPVQASPLGTSYRARKFVQKHQKPLVLALAFVALLLSAVVIVKAERDARQAQLSRGVNQALNQATALRERAKAANVGSAALFARAREQMQRALALVDDGLADAALTAQVSQLQAELDAEEKDRTLVAALDEAQLAKTETLSENRFASERAVPKFREAFRAYGLSAGEGEPAAAAERIRQRPAAVQEVIVAALEEWDDLAGTARYQISEPHRDWLRAVMAAAEPGDAWTKALRAALAEADGAKRRTTLEQLAAAVDVREHPPRTLTRLATRLESVEPAGEGPRYGASRAALALLRRAQRQYPADFWINEILGRGLAQEKAPPEELTEAVRFLTAAVALRPESAGAHLNLGLALARKGQFDEAIASYRTAIALDPKYVGAHTNLGNALTKKGQVDEAIVSYRTAIAFDPKYAEAHSMLGNALTKKGQVDEAIACWKKAIALDPKYAPAHQNLGIALQAKGQVDAAIACYQQVIALDRKNAMAHNAVGALLCDRKHDYDGAVASFRTTIALDPMYAPAHCNLGNALRQKGQVDAAIASYQKAIALDPKYVAAHINLGVVLCDRRHDYDGAIASYRTAIALDPKFATAHHNLAKALTKKGQVDAAIASYRTAIAFDPKYAVANNNLGTLLCDRKHDYEGAIASYRAAITLDPKYAYAHYNLGTVLCDQKHDYDGAIASFRTAIELDRKFATAQFSLGNALRQKGRVDAAIASYQQAIALDPKHALAHQNLGALLSDRKHDYDGAIASFRTTIALDPKNAPAHFNLGMALYHKGQVDAAIASYRTAIALDPKDAMAHYNLGTLLYDHKHDYDRAIASYRTAIALDPECVRAHNNLGNALRHKGQMDAAIASYHKAIELDPKYAMAHFNLGIVLRDQKRDYDGAIASFRTAIALDPEYVLAHRNLGAALADTVQVDAAIASYRTAIALDPKDAGAHNNLGNALADKGLVDAAIASYHKAIELEPKNVGYHSNLGAALADKGQVDEAIASYRTAIALDPKHAGAHNGLGTLLCESKHDYDGAIACFRTAIALDPKFARAHYNLGNALRDNRQVDAAIASYQKALTLDPKFALARTELAKAERLAAVQDKLPAFLKGEFQPTTNDERLALYDWCQIQKLYRTAAGLCADAFAADPKLADDLKAGHRYNAACSAALAAAGQGADATALEDTAKAHLRRQALAWLRADLALRTQQLENGPPAAGAAVQQLKHWQQDRDLADLRDAAALAKLPAEERTAWTQFWAEVAALMKKEEEKAHGR